jgi:hypothetical protein
MNDQELINKLMSRRGPWDEKPKEYVTKLEMVAVVHNIENELIEHEFALDYGNADDRKFLGRLTFWCITNKRSVECVSVSEWAKIKEL